jgi:integrase
MNRLPPGISKVELKSRRDGRPVVRYDVLIQSTANGRRFSVRKRCKTEQEARKFLSDTQAEIRRGTYVHKTKLTVEQACADWLASKHGIKASTKRGYEVWLAPLRQELGRVELQKLSKSDLDKLVSRLRIGDVPKHGTWTPRSINGLLGLVSALLEDKLKQGEVVRNVGKLVDRLPADRREMKTLAAEDMFKILDYPDQDRHLWTLALYGLRRGEIAGLRWKYVDFEKGTVEIAENRICSGGEIIVTTPKSKRSNRVLPMPQEVMDVLKDARGRIESEYVAAYPDGTEYHPNMITDRWGQLLRKLKIEYVRLHDARHSCATLMHLRGVPIAVIATWLGHASAAFTIATYAHSQEDALKDAALSYGRTPQ